MTITPTLTSTPGYEMKLFVYNEAGEVVRHLTKTYTYNLVEKLTTNTKVFSPDKDDTLKIDIDGKIYEWDGKNNQGDKVGNGVYYIKVETTDNYDYTHIIVESVTLLTNNLTTQLRIYNSVGEIVKIIPIEGIYQCASSSITVSPEPGTAFVPGYGNYAKIYYMDKEALWDGTNENGTVVNNGIYHIQLMVIDENGYKTVAQTYITVMHADYDVISDVQIIPNPFKPKVNNILTIKYKVNNNTKISIKVYNVAGELVKTLQDYNNTGEIKWEVTDSDTKLASGLYIMLIYAKTDNGLTKTVTKKFFINYKK
jgi:flagellar hook assembly protein FlgD